MPMVCAGALLECTFGVAPAPLIVEPLNRVFCPTPAATIMDFLPIANIPTFGLCDSILNPEVAAATAAALGVLTPMPCVPATNTPWITGAIDVTAGIFPVLDDESLTLCDWLGIITVVEPGQFTVEVP